MIFDSPPLPSDLARRTLRRLGFPDPPSRDRAGLAALYRAWGLHVPFDNTRKLIALRAGPGVPLPGADAEDFLEHWLADGTGGTCWPSSNALCEVLRAAGFAARRVIASMRDTGVPNHASVVVRVDGADWLADSSMLLKEPLPLGTGAFANNDPVWPAEVERRDGAYLVWWHTPPDTGYLPCRLLIDPASFQAYLDGYERSRERSPFNQRLYARRNRPDELVILAGPRRYVRDRSGVRSRDLAAGELRQSLRDEIGLSGDMVGRWADSGALAASLEPPRQEDPQPPADGLQPPSKRQAVTRQH